MNTIVVKKQVRKLVGSGKKIFVNGTFDVVHIGHLRMLNWAKSQGDHLHVAIDSDARVKTLKGQSRPFNNQHDRAEFLLNLKAVDSVVVFNSDEQLEFAVKSYDPHLMVVGSEYKDKTVIGSQFAEKLEFFERIDGYSTTRIIDR